MQNHDHTVIMPALGEASTEGTIARWLRGPGDRISAGETLAEIVTDKVSEELLAPISGTVGPLLIAAGRSAPVGTPLVRISPATIEGTTGSPLGTAHESTWQVVGDQPTATQALQSSTSAQQTRQASYDATARVAPLVRRLADEHGIDLTTVVGSGPGGRFTKDDIVGAVARKSSIRANSANPTDADGPNPLAPFPAREVGTPDTAEVQIHPPSPLRQAIAANLVRAVQGAPQAWTLTEVDASALLAYRDAQRAAIQARTGLVLSGFAAFVYVAARSIAAHPLINGAWRDGPGGIGAIGEAGGRVVTHRTVNAGIAVARPGGGLLVPVLRNAAELPLDALVSALDTAVSGARAGTLGADAYTGGTVTLNNTGALGSVVSQPILPHGTSAIITFEAIVKRPVVVADDAIAIRPMVNICLTFDHRVLDGLEACAFLQDLKRSLEGL